jgi:hypothetical protein
VVFFQRTRVFFRVSFLRPDWRDRIEFIHGEVDIPVANGRHGFFGVLSSRPLLFRYPIAYSSTRLNTLRKRLLPNIIDAIIMLMYVNK